MSAESQITAGALKRILHCLETEQPYTEEPVLQCLLVKQMAPQNGNDRYRVVLSDSVNFIQSLINTRQNELITSGKVQKGSFIRLTEFQSSIVKGKRFLIVLNLVPLEELGISERVGKPITLDPSGEEEDGSKPATISSNGFYGDSKPAVTAQSKPAPTRNTTTSRFGTQHGNLSPIESLSPYGNKWTIKVRCTSRSQIKTWHKGTSEGKLFSANFLDETGEIRATAFNEQCDTLYDLFQEGSVYYISSPCRVQIAKRQFSNVNNDYELVFERDTIVEKAEDQDDVPQIRFNFVSIGDLQNLEKDAIVDCIGVLKDVSDVSEITSKSNSTPYIKRELTIVDNSGFSVRVTIWGNTASSFDTPADSIIAFKGCKVSDFGGRSLSLLSSGSITFDPDIAEAHTLRGWYDAQGRGDTFATHSAMASGAGAAGGRVDTQKTLGQVRDENIGTSESGEYFSTKASVVWINKDNFAYRACETENCNKKVLEDNGMWRCERCGKSFANPPYRYMMSISVADHTGQLRMSCFDNVGAQIMGASASELSELKDADEKAFEDKINEACCRIWSLRCRAKMDTYNDQQRLKYQVVQAYKLNYANEAAKLAALIKSYNIN